MRVPLGWLSEFVDTKGLSPEAVGERLTMVGFELEALHVDGDETVLEFAVTPNRPDALSVRGMAREVHAGFARACTMPDEPEPTTTGADTHLQVQLTDPVRCPRYTAVVMNGVRVGPSPAAVQARLQAAGVRPINNVVDATNYVMLEYGQPLHAFDARFVEGHAITIRTAGAATTFKTLDGVERALLPDDLLICDAARPIALAGVMGGANSEIQSDTTRVVLESAYFAPTGIRRTSRRLGLSTESSKRFERGVDPNGVLRALQRVATLIAAWAGGRVVGEWIDCYPQPISAMTLLLPARELERVLGVSIAAGQVTTLLTAIGCEVASVPDGWHVTVPTARPDLTRPIDLVEEVARLYGYDHIPAALPRAAVAVPHHPIHAAWAAQCRERLRAQGFSEAVHYAFVPAATVARFVVPGREPIAIGNPLGEEPALLRTTLAGGLVEAVERNVRHGARHVRLFELRHVYWQEGAAARERLHLGGILAGERHTWGWSQSRDMVDCFDAKGVVEAICQWSGGRLVQCGNKGVPAFLHPGRAFAVESDGELCGWCGELHPMLLQQYALKTPVVLFELDADRLAAWASAHSPHYQPINRFPGVRRDLSLLVDRDLPAQRVLDTISELREPLLMQTKIFDVYQGDRLPPGKKSLTFAVFYRHPQRTLTDAEVVAVHERIVSGLAARLGIEVRGT
ncbi:MAG: phenylalanine--tRNA ligase subunit beta [Deltaproteobacteria bacterium]|nr:phenylalanine--tRNA ligase subunit beta [Deltaproteobacteria bacterium]